MIGRAPVAAALALLLGGAGAPEPETYVWRPVAIGAGGFITGLAGDAAGRVELARTDTYGAYRWSNARDRWEQLVTAASLPPADRRQAAMNEGVYEIAAAPSDPARLYMAIKGRVYRSDDGGGHWARAEDGGPFPAVFDPNSAFRHYGPFMAVGPRDPDLVLVGLPAAGLWRSTDGAQHWARVAGVPPSADRSPEPGVQAPGALIWFAPVGRVWAMSPGHGLFVSTDGGARFRPLPSRTRGPALLKHGAFAPDGAFFGVDVPGRAVWRYRGGAWRMLAGRGGLPRRDWAALAVARDGAIYVMDDGGVAFRSADGGESWRALPRRVVAGPGDPPWLHVAEDPYFATADLRFSPTDPALLHVAAGTGVWDARLTRASRRFAFVSRSRGIEQLVANDVVQPPGGAALFAAWDFGIHLRRDLNAFSTGYGPAERVLIAAQQLDWSAGDPRFVVTNASDTRVGCCPGDGRSVLAGYSRDGGATWARFATLPRPPGTRAGDPWAMAFGAIAVAAGDTANIVWEPAYDRAPFVTHDRGRSWQRVVFAGERLPNTGSFGDFALPRKNLAADRVLPATFYLAHSGGGANAALTGLWRSDDGGRRWAKVFAGEIAPNSAGPAKLRAAPGHAGHLFFTSAAATGDTRLRRSIDGGAHWRALDGVARVDDVAFGKAAPGADYPAIYLSGQVEGRYGIWRSLDEARTWRQVGGFPVGSLDQAVAVEADKDVFGRVYVGYQGSGWVYGRPAPCPARTDPRGADVECFHSR